MGVVRIPQSQRVRGPAGQLYPARPSPDPQRQRQRQRQRQPRDHAPAARDPEGSTPPPRLHSSQPRTLVRLAQWLTVSPVCGCIFSVFDSMGSGARVRLWSRCDVPGAGHGQGACPRWPVAAAAPPRPPAPGPTVAASRPRTCDHGIRKSPYPLVLAPAPHTRMPRAVCQATLGVDHRPRIAVIAFHAVGGCNARREPNNAPSHTHSHLHESHPPRTLSAPLHSTAAMRTTTPLKFLQPAITSFLQC